MQFYVVRHPGVVMAETHSWLFTTGSYWSVLIILNLLIIVY